MTPYFEYFKFCCWLIIDLKTLNLNIVGIKTELIFEINYSRHKTTSKEIMCSLYSCSWLVLGASVVPTWPALSSSMSTSTTATPASTCLSVCPRVCLSFRLVIGRRWGVYEDSLLLWLDPSLTSVCWHCEVSVTLTRWGKQLTTQWANTHRAGQNNTNTLWKSQVFCGLYILFKSKIQELSRYANQTFPHSGSLHHHYR